MSEEQCKSSSWVSQLPVFCPWFWSDGTVSEEVPPSVTQSHGGEVHLLLDQKMDLTCSFVIFRTDARARTHAQISNRWNNLRGGEGSLL